MEKKKPFGQAIDKLDSSTQSSNEMLSAMIAAFAEEDQLLDPKDARADLLNDIFNKGVQT